MDNQLQVITKQAAEVTIKASSIKTDITTAVTENNKSLQACIEAGENLLAQTATMTDELDAEIAAYIKKASATQKAMTERRKGITQVFDLIKSGFTKMEAFLDPKSEESVVYKLQKKRNEYAAYKLELQRKEEEERQRLARIEAAKAQLHNDVISVCTKVVHEKTTEALDRLSEKFRLLTLDNADTVKKEIQDYPTDINIAQYLKDRKPSYSPEIPEEEARAIMNNAFKTVANELTKSYTDSVAQAKQDILDTFDSKIAELQEQRRLEEERKRKEEEARKAEEERLRKEAELKAAEEAAEKERQQKLEEEHKRLEEEERLRRASAQTQTLFDMAPTVSAPIKAKVSHHIEIDGVDGFLPVMQMWWSHEGSKMTVEELGKKLGFMVKTCEKLKNKEDVTIVDANVRYVEDVVAK